MSSLAERPAWRISFRQLVAVALGLAAVAFLAGRYVYTRYGGYRPLALAHVPQNVRYRARVSLSDAPRLAKLGPLFSALDPGGARLAALQERLGVSAQQTVREVAFGAGPAPSDFVVVFGLQLQAGTGLEPARALCQVLAAERRNPLPTATGCRLEEGAVVAGTVDGSVVVASRAALVDGLLGAPELGDRLGFSGPSARGTAPEPADLEREARALGSRIAAAYP